MTEDIKIAGQLSALITARLSAGFIPDAETLHFASTSYGIQNGDELMLFLGDSSLNDGTIYELAVFPDDEFRVQAEKILPSAGLDDPSIADIRKSVVSSLPGISLITTAGKFIIDAESRDSCISSFISKLSLDMNISYIGESGSSPSPDFYYKARALLRRRRFIPRGDRGAFMSALLNSLPGQETEIENMLKLTDRAVTLLNGREEKSLDALAAKKYYYESMISESEEFAAMLKTYSMEFLMSKRIQPPPVSADDAAESIKIIDRLTLIVYGTVIPASDVSVQASISGDDPFSGIIYPV